MPRQQHRFHGDPQRFDALAEAIADRYGPAIQTVADVAGGQGMLARLLAKRHNYVCEVIDPRGWTLKGVQSRAEEYRSDMADYYDLIVGLHCDEALREVAASATIRPVILVPCCNFWSSEEKLGRDALLDAIQAYYDERGVRYERVTFPFRGPKNIGLWSEPPS